MAERINWLGIFMVQTQTTIIAAQEVRVLSNAEECIERLSLLVERKGSWQFDEIVYLIARLTAPIQFQSN